MVEPSVPGRAGWLRLAAQGPDLKTSSCQQVPKEGPGLSGKFTKQLPSLWDSIAQRQRSRSVTQLPQVRITAPPIFFSDFAMLIDSDIVLLMAISEQCKQTA